MPGPRKNTRQATSDRMTAMAQSYMGGYEGTPASQRRAGAKTGTKMTGTRRSTAVSKYPTKGGRKVTQQGPVVTKKRIRTREEVATAQRMTAQAKAYKAKSKKR